MTEPQNPPATLAELVTQCVAPCLDDPDNPVHPALAIGVVRGDEQECCCFGRLDRGPDSPRVDEHTLFEIGSITKLFTANLLALLSGEGVVRLDDPLQQHLPKVRVPAHGAQPITLRHLATHTSSLPRLPGNLDDHVRNAANPYADYSLSHLHDWLGAARLRRPVGTVENYSNLGTGLLGNALADAAGVSYEALVKDRLCLPLGMTETTIALTPQQRARTAAPHSADGAAVSLWELPALAGAGAVRSSVADMLRYVAANLGRAPASLQPALDSCQQVQHRIPPYVAGWKSYLAAALLSAGSLFLQHAWPIPPGSWTFLAVLLLPIVIAARRGGVRPAGLAAVTVVLGSAILWGEKFDGTAGTVAAILAVFLLGKRRGGGEQRLGWLTESAGNGEEILWHNGATGGSCSFLAINKARRTGVIVLSNSENPVDELGLELLDSLVEEPQSTGGP